MRIHIRQLWKSPGFALTAILTLALGISATTSIFSLVNAVLLRPLPFPQPDRLMWVQQLDEVAHAPETLSYPDFFDWRSQNQTFQAIASYRGSSYTLTGMGEAQHLNGEIVSAEFFRVLGVQPLVGRGFIAEDETPGAHVAVLGHDLWQSRFGSNRNIAGQAITLDGHSYTVAGVMPPGFAFPIQNPAPALWTTLADDAADKNPMTEQRGADMLTGIGRLKPGVSVDRARADLSMIARRLAAHYPDSNKPNTAAVVKPEIEELVGDVKPALRIFFAAVLFVLLIACANVAGLFLARASRRTDIAVRVALGANRSEILRQVLTEALLLSISAGVLGVVITSFTLKALPYLLPKDLPRLGEISIDASVLLFSLAASLFTGLLFGVAPAWRMSRLDPSTALRDGTRNTTAGRGQQRVQNWLVIGETALGLVLLAGSGLLIRSFVNVLNVDLGFNPKNVLTASLTLPESHYPRERRIQFYQQLMQRVATMPGVKSVSAGFPLLLSNIALHISFAIEGRPVAAGDEPAEAMNVVLPDYFQTMRRPILSGRGFTWNDDANSKQVIIINQKFARKYFPGENPLGKRIKAGLGDGLVEHPVREVVGIVSDVKRQRLTADVDPQYYLPWSQAVITSPPLCIRTAGDPTALIPALRASIAEMDRDVPLYAVRTVEDSVTSAAATPRFQTLLISVFAAMALLLSAIGLYAVLSYTVAQRVPEIGLRIALGAQRNDVMGLIWRRGLALAIAGIVIGLGASAVLSDYLSGMLYRVAPLDPLTLGVVSAVLLLVAFLASTAPAWRAARVDPMRTLRSE